MLLTKLRFWTSFLALAGLSVGVASTTLAVPTASATNASLHVTQILLGSSLHHSFTLAGSTTWSSMLTRIRSSVFTIQTPRCLLGVNHHAWTWFWADSSPSSMSNSVASAACSQIVGTSARSVALKVSSTNAAGSLRPGGRPIPMRTR